MTEGYGRALVESLAQLHAHRWAQPPPDAAAIEASFGPAMAGLPVMLDAMQEGFSAAQRAVTAMRWLWQTHVRRALAAVADARG